MLPYVTAEADNPACLSSSPNLNEEPQVLFPSRELG